MAIYMPWVEQKGTFKHERDHKESYLALKQYREKRKRRNKIARASRKGRYMK